MILATITIYKTLAGMGLGWFAWRFMLFLIEEQEAKNKQRKIYISGQDNKDQPIPTSTTYTTVKTKSIIEPHFLNKN